MNMTDTNKKPAAKVTLYPITAAVWRNESKEGDTFYSVTFERSYRDSDGNWKSSNSFNGDDLLLLAKVADLAHTECSKLKSADRQAQPADKSAAA
jgi:hypothetical protein